jgi:hypothetical protein
MDERPPSAPSDPDRPPIDHAELRAILSNLSHELGRQLVSLRAGFDLVLGDDTWASSPEQRGHLRTMARLVRQPARVDAELSRLRRPRPGGRRPAQYWLVHHRGP